MPEDQHFFEGGEDGEGILYVGDKGILLAGFNGNHPRVYPQSPKYVAPEMPHDEGEHHDVAIEQWIAACKGGPAPLANFETESPVTEAFLLGCIAQRMPGTLLEWDTARMRITSSEKANAFLDPPVRNLYTA